MKKRYEFTEPRILEELQQIASYFQERKQFAPQTIQVYCNYIGAFLSWFNQKGSQATYQDILHFISYCQEENYSTKHINLMLTALRHYFDYLRKQKSISHNPAEHILLKGETQIIPQNLLNPEELRKLYESYPVYSPRTQRNKVILGLLVFQGITTGELKSLHIEHLKLEKGIISIPSSQQTAHKKGRKARVLPLQGIQIVALQTYLQHTRPQLLNDILTGKVNEKSTRKPQKINVEALEKQLFFSTNGSENLKPTLKHLFLEVKAMNPKVKDAQQIRQSVIVNWLKVKDIRHVQYLAGHGSISSTERYRAANLEALTKAVEQYHPLQ